MALNFDHHANMHTMKISIRWRAPGTWLPLALLAAGCHMGGPRVTGAGPVKEEQRDLGAFGELVLLGGFHLQLRPGPAAPATVSAEGNLLPYIETRVDGDKLVVKFRDNVHINAHAPIHVTVTAPEVRKLHLAGSGDIVVEDTLRADAGLEFNSAGSGSIRAAVRAPSVDVRIAGSGDVTLSGMTREAEADILGSGNLKGRDLKSETADVKIAGSGNVNLFVSRQLEAHILGSGNVYYGGTPATSSHIAGSGQLVRQE